MPLLCAPGTEQGRLRDDLRRELQLPDAVVVQPATHDTASAVAGTPLRPHWAYISSGTWSLVGVERTTPLLDGRVLEANFTNERGVCDTFRFLKNVAGLWILECCRREWRAEGLDADMPRLLDGAAALRESGANLSGRAAFLQSCEHGRRAAWGAHRGRPARAEGPRSADEGVSRFARLALPSVIKAIERLTGECVEGIHIVGGGARNTYLNQATANATGRPVLAGPVEATGLGNLLVQAAACGITPFRRDASG